MCIATLNNLTAWRNGDVKLATGECIAADPWIDAIITQPHEITTRQGKPGGYIAGRYGGAMTDGFVRSTHRFNTVQFCYWLMQTASDPTTEGTPVSYNTHALTHPTVQTPFDLGMHYQTALTGNNLYWDLLGVLPQRLTISCSEYDRTAKQVLEAKYAYLQSASDSFTKTARAEGTTGSITKTWDHAVTGGMGAAQTVLLGGTGAAANTECDIIGFTINLERNTWMGTRDANGYATAGLMQGFNWSIQLEVIPTGDALFTLARTKKVDYSDLDLTFSMTADATNDKITFDFQKLFMTNFDRSMSYSQRPESYVINLEPYDQTSTCAITGIDSLDNDNYANP